MKEILRAQPLAPIWRDGWKEGGGDGNLKKSTQPGKKPYTENVLSARYVYVSCSILLLLLLFFRYIELPKPTLEEVFLLFLGKEMLPATYSGGK